MAFKYSVDPSVFESAIEGLTVNLPAPTLAALPVIHKSLVQKNGGKSLGRYIISLVDMGPRKLLYAVYVEKGWLSKKFEFVENLELNFDEYLALRQFYYSAHAYYFDKIFNYVDVAVESDGNTVKKVGYAFGYDEKIDPSSSAGGASHVAPVPSGIKSDVPDVESNIWDTTRGEVKGATPLKV